MPDEAHVWARAQWDNDGRPVLMISPCSSHARRNWYADRHAALADHAAAQGWRIVLCGGRSELERSTADAIVAAARTPILDLVGKDTLKQLPALLARADLVVTPDSGPMHIANAMGTKAPACMQRAIRCAAARIRTCAIVWTVTTRPPANTWASRPIS